MQGSAELFHSSKLVKSVLSPAQYGNQKQNFFNWKEVFLTVIARYVEISSSCDFKGNSCQKYNGRYLKYFISEAVEKCI